MIRVSSMMERAWCKRANALDQNEIQASYNAWDCAYEIERRSEGLQPNPHFPESRIELLREYNKWMQYNTSTKRIA